MPLTRIALLAALSIPLAAGSVARAQELGAAQFAATTLQISAEGEVRVKPDLAVLSLGVQADAPTAEGAFAKARVEMASTISQLRARGIAEADIQTSGLSLQAQYADDAPAGSTGRGPPRVAGYEASDTATVRLHDLNRVGEVVDALVAAGANRLDMISFQLSDPAAARTAACRQAIHKLQAEANADAEAVGYRVRRLVSLSNLQNGGPIFQPMAMSMAIALPLPKVRAPTPIAPGELTITAGVNALYELTPAR